MASWSKRLKDFFDGTADAEKKDKRMRQLRTIANRGPEALAEWMWAVEQNAAYGKYPPGPLPVKWPEP